MTDRLASSLYSVGAFRQTLAACRGNEVVHCPGFLSSIFCEEMVAQLKGSYSRLPTSNGKVYELYAGELPQPLQELALNLTNEIKAFVAKGRAEPRVEVLRYFDGSELEKHRDHEGNAFTKLTITLGGKGLFLAEKNRFVVCQGSLVAIRGRDLVDVPTPIHGVAHNHGRIVLLIEPLFIGF